MKTSKKIISAILSFVLLVSVFSVATPVLAAELVTSSDEEFSSGTENSTVISSVDLSQANVIGEDESRRTADTKHFIMSDGSRRAVVYSFPVHYDNNGKWQEIDNTLSYDKNSKTYKNKNNSFKVSFSEDFNSSQFFSIENRGYTLSWEYAEKSLLRTSPKAEYKVKEASDDKILSYSQKTEDKISYNNFKSGCKLEYVVVNNGVKENIILSNKYAGNEFSFNIKANNLTLSKNSDGSISAKNADNEELFFIPAPFMYDSNNVYSYDVSYTLTGGNGVYTLTILANKEWLQNSERAYPVTIDPVIFTEQKSSSVSSTFVASDMPYEIFGSRQDVYVGVESSSYGKCHALFKTDLPALNKGDMVIGATLNLCLDETSFVGDTTRQLNAHIITSAWEENSVKWSNKPSYNSVILDYNFMSAGDAEWKKFDITKAVKQWYEGTVANNGILIKSDNESGDPARAIFWSENANDQTGYYPVIAIDYRNNKGTESYWSYSSFSAGVAGNANVNDYTGNLVYSIPLASSVSEIMPVSIGLVYNSYSSSQLYTAGKNSSNLTSAGMGWKLNVQQTILPSSQYGLTGEAATKYPYVYTDGDGTEHYIVKTTEEDGTVVYKDEDGLGFTFTHPATSIAEYKLEQDDGSYMFFNKKGNLTNICDSYSNPITLQYDSNGTKLQKIIDGTNHTYTIKYYRNSTDTADTNFIQTITDNAGRTINLTVINCILYDVTFNDNASKAYIRYTTGVNGADQNLIDYTWSTDGNGLAFSYLAKSKGSRVNKVTEFSSETLAGAVASQRITGAVVTFDRKLYNTTEIRTPGVDGVHKNTNSANGSDDVITTLQFDNAGRTISQKVKYGNNEEVGAGTYSYTGDSAVESRNKIASAATLNKNTINYLSNTGFESDGSWVNGSSGGVTATQAYTTEDAYYGNMSMKISNTAVTSACKNYVYQKINNPTVGYYYTFSAYVKATSLTLYNNLSTKAGAYLCITAFDENNTYITTTYSPIIQEETTDFINDGWRRIYVTMQIPQGTKMVHLLAMLDSAEGTMYVDGAQFEVSVAPNSMNLVENADFEKTTSSAITGWAPVSGVTYSSGKDGSATVTENDITEKVLKLTGSSTQNKGFYQLISVKGNASDTYIVSGWAKANAVNSTYHENASFEIAARVTYSCSDGTTVTQYKTPAKFNTTVSEWQFSSGAFSLAYKKTGNDTKTYTPTHIMVVPTYSHQVNSAYFKDIQLIQDVAQTYIYDKEGNPITVSANAEQKSNMTYDGDDLKTYKDAAGYTSEFTYNNKHLLLQAKTPKGVKTNYTYNGQGQLISTETVNVGGEAKTLTSQTYTSGYSGIYAGAYLSSITDELGKTTSYTYNMPTGAKTKVTDALNNSTTYTYNSTFTKMLKVMSGSTSVVYAYDGNRVENIKFGHGADTTYYEEFSFVYDTFGNVLNTKVGSTSLVTNEYGTNNGLLQKSSYANGDAIRYTYSKAGLVTGIYQDNNAESANPAFTWGYSANGTPRVHKDGYTKLKYNYSYDSIGRLIRTDISDSQTSAYVGSTEYGYDKRNNLTTIVNDIGGNVYSQNYRYHNTGVGNAAEDTKDNLPIQYWVLGTNTNYTYDSLNRLSCKTVDTTNDIVTNYRYSPAKINDITYFTHQLSAEDVNGTSYHYTYDAVGNIIAIQKGTGVNSASVNYRGYTYDNLNRLITEEQYDTCQVIEYTYNHLGNLRFKTISTYPDNNFDESTPTSVKEIEYTYTDDGKDGWNYLLTSYDENGDKVIDDNEKISYDEIGNPLTYRGATVSWYSRQMKSFVKDGVTTTMTYDADGLRSSKTVGGVKTEYQYVGDKLYYEKRGNNQIFYYFYDSYGNLAVIYYTFVNSDGSKSTAAYHVATNSQGDVIALYRNNGELYARYEYDAWGNTISITDANGNEITAWYNIAVANPIRYRGYYYDKDLGLYYLQSRYYDSQTGRFVNADGYISTGQGVTSYNMFAYCNNNPVMYSDFGGDMFESIQKWISQKWNCLKKGIQERAKRKARLPFISNGKESGAKIVNSHAITNPVEMYIYVETKKNDEISGSTTGVVVEWVIHNIAYEVGEQLTEFGYSEVGDELMNKAGSVDVGSTIYDDDHSLMSFGMWYCYSLILPGFAIYDLIIEIEEQE